jgi:hypothetical protein
MINAKITKSAPKESTEERLFKLLESIDWKLWEMYNMMKDNVPSKPASKVVKKTKADEE